jgi:hypothetical protein
VQDVADKKHSRQQCVYKIVAGRSSFQLLITILLLWLIEPDVFQLPQLHKHFNVIGYPPTDIFKSAEELAT